ncbi:hypothetical protein QC334_30335 [Streptomyces sp. DH18]|uniref:hypothetical protein n=1 Tax=Streptomyces sp. DH18 TaxID=3040126 RepID=UPI002440EEDF|nr:hypothetical protein [Streptomyces sp. DH18]MDG9686976.1 hypothetical protein [Streptomyces sp. DH18]
MRTGCAAGRFIRYGTLPRPWSPPRCGWLTAASDQVFPYPYSVIETDPELR